jgi:hypothetical protein
MQSASPYCPIGLIIILIILISLFNLLRWALLKKAPKIPPIPLTLATLPCELQQQIIRHATDMISISAPNIGVHQVYTFNRSSLQDIASLLQTSHQLRAHTKRIMRYNINFLSGEDAAVPVARKIMINSWAPTADWRMQMVESEALNNYECWVRRAEAWLRASRR